MDTKECNVTNNITISNSNVSIGSCCGESNLPDCDKDYSNSPYNHKNYYDSLGQIHNLLLEECRIYTLEKIEKNPPEKIDLMWCVDVSTYILRQNHYELKENAFYEIAKHIIEDANNWFENYINKVELLSENKKILIELIQNLKKLSDEEIVYYYKYKETILKYEEIFLNKFSLKDKELIVLLSAMSILRHSLFYWFYNINEEEETKAKKGVWRKVVMGLCDAAGAIGGGIAGAVAGTAVLPGAGTALGASAGAVTGAITASNGAATLWDNYVKK
ncbi:MAG: hypothetical protein LBV69_11595 [Bacteroidales bacterium]|jgi:hypothetical protein|nr:hypothetical protein [Bacteroidales bacterium]